MPSGLARSLYAAGARRLEDVRQRPGSGGANVVGRWHGDRSGRGGGGRVSFGQTVASAAVSLSTGIAPGLRPVR